MKLAFRLKGNRRDLGESGDCVFLFASLESQFLSKLFASALHFFNASPQSELLVCLSTHGEMWGY